MITERPDIVMLDLGMPRLDGIGVLEGIRAWSQVPVLVLSGRTDSSDKVDALDAGADDYVTKPFQMDELLARLRALGRRQATAAASAGVTPTVTIGDLVVDLVAKQVTPPTGPAIRLTPTEWRLLEVLVTNPGRLMTREMLLTEVWGPTHGNDSGYLRLYMAQLRRKLEPEPSHPRFLVTSRAWGTGSTRAGREPSLQRRFRPRRHARTMRVLVVDDEVRLADGIRAGLQAEGFAVDVAHDGVDGLWYAREHPYDAIVLDLMMPGMSGWKVCETLRAEQDWTPVLMLTAKDGEWDQVDALDAGADDYVTKPFSFPVLVARLRALVRRGSRERPTVLQAGDLRLDPAERRVWRGEDLLDLTSREFTVLEYLMRHAGQVLSKRDVIANVWDDDFAGDPNIVEVYVGHLRRKVDRPFGRTAIETVRGAGYRLDADGG